MQCKWSRGDLSVELRRCTGFSLLHRKYTFVCLEVCLIILLDSCLYAGNLSIILDKQNNDSVVIVDPLNDGRDETCRCGSSAKGKYFVVGGYETNPHEFPWLVGIYKDNHQFCGGSLINSYYVLTAAHCLYGNSFDEISIVVGLHDKKYPAFRVWVENFSIHSKYKDKKFVNDIALMKLKREVTFSDVAQPICIPTDDQNYEGKNATVAGWGKIVEKGESSDVLRKVDLPIRPASHCKQHFAGDITTILCAYVEEGGKDACQGDSGGPLMINENGWHVIGIVSWGMGCARPHTPAGYTRVSKYSNWIKTKLGKYKLCSA